MDTFTRLYLIRHGQVLNFDSGVLNGHNDVDLSDEGMRQMHAVARRLEREPVSVVVSSDLVRTRKGAVMIAGQRGITPVADASLRELNFGSWTGCTFRQIQERFPGELDERARQLVDYRVPGGESLRDLAARVLAAMEKIRVAHAGETIALVAHGGVNRVIIAHALGLDLRNFYSVEQDYGCINVIDYYSDIAVVKLVNGRTETDF